jgi:type IV pilus assembly protein PilA
MRDQKGFTLIELLIVVAIIGILAAIAVPFFAQYRQRAHDARALNDCWDAITAEEAFYVSHQSYMPLGPLGPSSSSTHIDTPGFTLAPTNVIEVTTSGLSFTVTVYSTNGTTRYRYDNVNSRIIYEPL